MSLFAIDRERIDLVAEMIDVPAVPTRGEAQIRLDVAGLDVALQRARGDTELTGRFRGGDQGRLRHASHSKLLGGVSSPPETFLSPHFKQSRYCWQHRATVGLCGLLTRDGTWRSRRSHGCPSSPIAWSRSTTPTKRATAAAAWRRAARCSSGGPAGCTGWRRRPRHRPRGRPAASALAAARHTARTTTRLSRSSSPLPPHAPHPTAPPPRTAALRTVARAPPPHLAPLFGGTSTTLRHFAPRRWGAK